MTDDSAHGSTDSSSTSPFPETDRPATAGDVARLRSWLMAITGLCALLLIVTMALGVVVLQSQYWGPITPEDMEAAEAEVSAQRGDEPDLNRLVSRDREARLATLRDANAETETRQEAGETLLLLSAHDSAIQGALTEVMTDPATPAELREHLFGGALLLGEPGTWTWLRDVFWAETNDGQREAFCLLLGSAPLRGGLLAMVQLLQIGTPEERQVATISLQAALPEIPADPADPAAWRALVNQHFPGE